MCYNKKKKGGIAVYKRYSISETTRVEREKIVYDALGISTLDAAEPTEKTMKLVNQYIIGKMEISEVLEITLKGYRSIKL